MTIQKETISTKKISDHVPKDIGVVSLIDVAAHLDDPVYRRTIKTLSMILEELKSIKTPGRQQIRGSPTFRRYIE
jgi:hypothetical protein